MQREKVNIDEKLLTQIANETGGHYYRAKDNESLKNIYAEIDRLEKSKVEVSSIRRYTEQFFPLRARRGRLTSAGTAPPLDSPAKVPLTSRHAGKSLQIHRVLVCRQDSRRIDLECPPQRHF